MQSYLAVKQEANVPALCPAQEWGCCYAKGDKGKYFLLSRVELQPPQWIYPELCHIFQWHSAKEVSAILPGEGDWDLAQVLGPSPTSFSLPILFWVYPLHPVFTFSVFPQTSVGFQSNIHFQNMCTPHSVAQLRNPCWPLLHYFCC